MRNNAYQRSNRLKYATASEFNTSTPETSCSCWERTKPYSPAMWLLVFVGVVTVVAVFSLTSWHVWRVYVKHHKLITPLYEPHVKQNEICIKNPALKHTADFKRVCDQSAAFVQDSLMHMAWEAVLREEALHFNWILEPLALINDHPIWAAVAAGALTFLALYSGQKGVAPFVIQMLNTGTSTKEHPMAGMA